MFRFRTAGPVVWRQPATGLLRRIATPACWAGVVLAAVLADSAVRAADPARRPNLVFILADDME